ncbi:MULTISPECIES: hypothetical protein [Clostridium]|uniref:hypothetical protein n=1 Tax=Clostridium TaxID=1485 RepID=UPI00243137AF|nr:hypothetical protein [Clostridium tyrobutyricum]
MDQNNIITRKLTSSAFQRQIFEELLDFFRIIGIMETSGSEFQKREPTKLIEYFTTEELYSESINQLKELIVLYPKLTFLNYLTNLIEVFNSQGGNGNLLLNSYLDFSDLKKSYLKESNYSSTNILLKADRENVYIESTDTFIEESPDLKEYFDDIVIDKKFMTSAMNVCKEVRNQGRNFTADETSSIWFSYSLLKKGYTLDYGYTGLGTSGFRKWHQTLIFSTDPGDDHIRITAMDKKLMDGVAVHVEHIDRDMVTDKNKVEAYRLPAAINAVKVRLHISDDAPVTAFIGRPVFENGYPDIQAKGYVTKENFDMDKLKSVHMTASACNTMFQNGVCDCKVAIERMQVSDAIEFMKSVVGNVMRDSTKQTLAAAFNINTPIFDDVYSNTEITKPFEIAKLGIKIAVAGGFDRITWDGADSIHVPSIPVINQMTHREFVELVHTAHENGLQTYFSAGLTVEDIEKCVITGVDGLGIGTSLHYMDKQTHLMGAFDPKAILSTLEKRNEIENSVLGKSALFLAKLDRIYYEKTIHEDEDKIRIDLYNVLLNQDIKNAAILLKDPCLKRVKEISYEGPNNVLGRAIRSINFYISLIDKKVPLSEEQVQIYETIGGMLSKNDVSGLQKIFQNQGVNI